MSTSPLLMSAQLARERWTIGALDAWLIDGGSTPPWPGAQVWRVWLPRDKAARLVSELVAERAAVRLAAQFEARGVYLYLWPVAYVRGLAWLLWSYSAGAALIDPSSVPGGGAWACGKALARLLSKR